MFPDTSRKLRISVDSVLILHSYGKKKSQIFLIHATFQLTVCCTVSWLLFSWLPSLSGGLQPWRLQRFRCCLHASTQNQLPVNSSTSACCFGLFFCFDLPHLQPALTLSDHQSTTVNCHLDGIPLPPSRATGNNRCKTENDTRHRTCECCVRYRHTGRQEHKYKYTIPVQYWCCP